MKRSIFRVIYSRCRKIVCRVANAPFIAVQRLMENMESVHWAYVVGGIVLVTTFFILSYRLSLVPSREELQERQVEQILEPRNCQKGKDRPTSCP